MSALLSGAIRGGAAARLNGLAEDPLADDDSFARLAEADKRRWAQGAAEDAGLAAKMRRLAEVEVVTRVHVRLVGFDGDRDDNSNLRVQPTRGSGGDGGRKGGGDLGERDERTSGVGGWQEEAARGVLGMGSGKVAAHPFRPSPQLTRVSPCRAHHPCVPLPCSPPVCPPAVLTPLVPPMPPFSLTCVLPLPAAAMPCHGGHWVCVCAWAGGDDKVSQNAQTRQRLPSHSRRVTRAGSAAARGVLSVACAQAPGLCHLR
ncbi:unnamed protein product [Closterium sp. NIES-64]|nr:unnamed protein product [Closterium sp. NIES-64]